MKIFRKVIVSDNEITEGRKRRKINQKYYQWQGIFNVSGKTGITQYCKIPHLVLKKIPNIFNLIQDVRCPVDVLNTEKKN